MNNDRLYLNLERNEIVYKIRPFQVGGYDILDLKTPMIICFIYNTTYYLILLLNPFQFGGYGILIEYLLIYNTNFYLILMYTYLDSIVYMRI